MCINPARHPAGQVSPQSPDDCPCSDQRPKRNSGRGIAPADPPYAKDQQADQPPLCRAHREERAPAHQQQLERWYRVVVPQRHDDFLEPRHLHHHGTADQGTAPCRQRVRCNGAPQARQNERQGSYQDNLDIGADVPIRGHSVRLYLRYKVLNQQKKLKIDRRAEKSGGTDQDVIANHKGKQHTAVSVQNPALEQHTTLKARQRISHEYQ